MRVKLLGLMLSALCGVSQAAELIEMKLVDADGVQQAIGKIKAEDSPYGLLLSPDLQGLPAGLHGFHVHTNPNCGMQVVNGVATAAMAAGGHWDPEKTDAHLGPYGNGHKGDLPALFVGADGKATYPVLAPRLKLADLKGHALMLHAGGDNHSDHPAKLGGGGARMACAVVN